MVALRKSVLLGGRFLMDDVRARLESGFAVRVLPNSESECDAFLAQHGRDFEGAIATSASGEMMDETPNLKIIACYGVGYDGIDADAAARRGIWVSNTPDVLNDDVADLAIGLMLAVVRRIPAAQCFAKDEWSSGGSFPLTDRLTGRRLGMLGMGRIGGAIVRRALGFGMEISYHATAPKPDSPHRWAENPVALARECDVLCAAAPATPQTRGIVNAEVLQALGKNQGEGYFVNIGRGALVDEEALVSALANKVVAGAALDVFENEPHIPDALKHMDNVVLSPHQASATKHTRRAMGMLAVENVEAVLKGLPPKTPVNHPDNPR